MARLNFQKISSERKQKMREVLSNWERSGTPVCLLEEGLQLLTSPKRPTMSSLSTQGRYKLMGIIYTFGTGSKPRLTLTKDDAQVLLELVSELRKHARNEEALATLVDKATSVLLQGQKNHLASTDEMGDVLRKVLQEFDPMVNQDSLF